MAGRGATGQPSEAITSNRCCPLLRMVRPTGLEPVTPGLGILCSIRLSYGRARASHSKRAVWAIVLLLGVLGGPAGAQTPPTVTLGDGRDVGLSGLAWSASRQDVREEANAILSELAGSGTLHVVTERRDRYGRVVAQVGDDGGGWLQGRLLEQGLALARVEGETDDWALRLLEAERRGRSASLGIWSGPLPVVSVEHLSEAPWLPGYQLVEGRIRAVAEQGGAVYLNFGDDWKTDVTFRLDRAVASTFEREGVDPTSLNGRMIRVRGWVYEANGPMIDVISRHQMEILL